MGNNFLTSRELEIFKLLALNETTVNLMAFLPAFHILWNSLGLWNIKEPGRHFKILLPAVIPAYPSEI